MLILTRRPGETIRIAPDIVIQVLRVCGNSVRLGVSAPRGTRIMRGELLAAAVDRAADDEEEAAA